MIELEISQRGLLCISHMQIDNFGIIQTILFTNCISIFSEQVNFISVQK